MSTNRGRTRSVRSAKAPFTVEALLGAVAERAKGRIAVEIWDERCGERLWELVDQCAKQGVSLEDVRLVGEWLGDGGGLAYRQDLDAVWLAKPGNLIGAVGQARNWVASGKPKPKPKNGTLGRRRGMTAREVLEFAAARRAK